MTKTISVSITPAFAMMFFIARSMISTSIICRKRDIPMKASFPKRRILQRISTKHSVPARISSVSANTVRAGAQAVRRRYWSIFTAGVLTFLQITSIIRIRWYITRFLMLWSRQHFSLQNIFSVFTIIPAQSFRLTEMQ